MATIDLVVSDHHLYHDIDQQGIRESPELPNFLDKQSGYAVLNNAPSDFTYLVEHFPDWAGLENRWLWSMRNHPKVRDVRVKHERGFGYTIYPNINTEWGARGNLIWQWPASRESEERYEKSLESFKRFHDFLEGKTDEWGKKTEVLPCNVVFDFTGHPLTYKILEYRGAKVRKHHVFEKRYDDASFFK